MIEQQLKEGGLADERGRTKEAHICDDVSKETASA